MKTENFERISYAMDVHLRICLCRFGADKAVLLAGLKVIKMEMIKMEKIKMEMIKTEMIKMEMIKMEMIKMELELKGINN